MAQLDPEASSLGTVEGNVSDREAVEIEDIVSRSHRFKVKQLDVKQSLRGAHNLLEGKLGTSSPR